MKMQPAEKQAFTHTVLEFHQLFYAKRLPMAQRVAVAVSLLKTFILAAAEDPQNLEQARELCRDLAGTMLSLADAPTYDAMLKVMMAAPSVEAHVVMPEAEGVA